MKIGVKVWSEDFEYAKKISKYCDFLEVMAMSPKHIAPLKEINTSFTVHNLHWKSGINFANRKKHHLNYSSLLMSFKFADELNSEVVIIHPGLVENNNCNLDNAISFFNKIGDERIVFENMPLMLKSKKLEQVGARFEEVKKLLDYTKTSFCLDFSHAMMTGKSISLNPYEYARKFLSLNPRIFHIGGLELGDTMEDMNEHLHFEESKVDIREITGLIPKDAKVVIETKLDLEKQKKEILFLKKIFG